jgi:predicted nucleic acid-binding protein
MSVLLDTGIVYAYYDRSDAWHDRARTLVQGEQRGLILPSPVIPEVDHLLGQAYARIADLNRRFDDLDLGFVDAAVAALAETLGFPRVATTDRRHFEPLAAALSLQLLP